MVEKAGRSVQGLFPLTTLWDGTSCGREQECITCYQGAEVLPDCTRQSVLYENVCTRCVPGATSKEQLKEEELNAIFSIQIFRSSNILYENIQILQYSLYKYSYIAILSIHIFRSCNILHTDIQIFQYSLYKYSDLSIFSI